MQRRLYIDEAHTALDIFRFAVFFLFFSHERVLEELALLKIAPVLAHRLLYSQSNKLKFFSSHSISPCSTLKVKKTCTISLTGTRILKCSSNFQVKMLIAIFLFYHVVLPHFSLSHLLNTVINISDQNLDQCMFLTPDPLYVCLLLPVIYWVTLLFI